MTVYADSSFIVSLYLTDAHSSEARHRVKQARQLILTPFHQAEWAHALAQHLFRGDLSREDARRTGLQFSADQDAGRFRRLSFPDRAFELCADLASQHGPELPLRTLDSLHVACALELKADRFWTFDERQAKLAKAQGLKTG